MDTRISVCSQLYRCATKKTRKEEVHHPWKKGSSVPGSTSWPEQKNNSSSTLSQQVSCVNGEFKDILPVRGCKNKSAEKQMWREMTTVHNILCLWKISSKYSWKAKIMRSSSQVQTRSSTVRSIQDKLGGRKIYAWLQLPPGIRWATLKPPLSPVWL